MKTRDRCRARLPLPLACILLTALAFRLVVIVAFGDRFRDDSLLYDAIAWNLAQGHGFSQSATPPHLPTTRVVPGYPLFLAAVYAVAGHTPAAAVLAQVLLELGTIYLVYLCATQVFDTRTGLLAAALAALCPALAGYASWLLTETLFTFLLVLFCWLMLRATHSARYASFCWAGLAAGAAAMVRGQILAFLPLWTLALAALGRHLRRLIPRVTMAAVCVTVIVAPWIVRNRLQTGRVVLADGQGFQMYVRALMITHPTEEARALYRQQREAYSAAGYSTSEVDRIMQQMGLDIIVSDPLAYVASIGYQSIAIWRGSFSEAFRMQEFAVYVSQRDWVAAAIKILLAALWNLLPPLAILGMLTAHKSWRRWWPLALLLLYWTLFHAAASTVQSRYMVPVYPVAYIFSAQGLLFLWIAARSICPWPCGAQNRHPFAQGPGSTPTKA
jgi:4-amino-4-deoxy-L-arabinose transferase-like glycosyltransferase